MAVSYRYVIKPTINQTLPIALRLSKVTLFITITITISVTPRENRMQNRLTIKDIARLSGVGKSTVSRVLNNESGVSERTRERVEAVMNQHGFSVPLRPCDAGTKR